MFLMWLFISALLVGIALTSWGSLRLMGTRMEPQQFDHASIIFLLGMGTFMFACAGLVGVGMDADGAFWAGYNIYLGIALVFAFRGVKTLHQNAMTRVRTAE